MSFKITVPFSGFYVKKEVVTVVSEKVGIYFKTALNKAFTSKM